MTDNAGLSHKEKLRQETKDQRKVQFKERRRAKAECKLVGFRQSTHYIDSTLTNESIYYVDDQSPRLRKVHPYFFTWVTHAKERWYGRTIEDVFQHEFRRAILKQNFDDIIRNGLIRINGQCVEKEYIIRNGDKLEHHTHRHEVPIINETFKILINNDDYLVIDKPCSLPVHVGCSLQTVVSYISLSLSRSVAMWKVSIQHRTRHSSLRASPVESPYGSPSRSHDVGRVDHGEDGCQGACHRFQR